MLNPKRHPPTHQSTNNILRPTSLTTEMPYLMKT